jgi:glycine/D-amino acid oxidase-like deaminating enzyme/nitrite reductase/ring-hydroxylating ferredoxin subunit
MNAIGEGSVSVWMDAPIPDAPILTGDISTDVAVVGAGIAGLSVAYELCLEGRSVVALDAGPLGGGMTSRTTAHLNCTLDDFYHELIRVRGEEQARHHYASRAAAIDRIEEIHRSERIDCDFRRLDSYLFAARSADADKLKAELDACKKIGLQGAAWIAEPPIRDAGAGGALYFPRQARFHPRKYLAGLREAIGRRGGRLYANTRVAAVEEGDGIVTLRTARGPSVRARIAVIATNSPITDWIAVHTKQAPYRSYAIAGRVPRGSVADALYWDTLDPYHYVRLQECDDANDWLIVGGEDHKTGQGDDAKVRVAKLEAWARSLVPPLGAIEFRWSGQVLEPVDFLPYSGRNPGNESVFVHTGDSGEGITNAVAGSLIIRDLMCGRPNAWAEAVDPSRVSRKSIRDFAAENLSAPANLAGYVAPDELLSVDDLAAGSGAIIRRGAAKVAAYRDPQGNLHLRAATCTHAGCLVHWNSFETCWDCTCHGSHFAVDGEPLNAPAFTPLAEVEENAAEIRVKQRA